MLGGIPLSRSFFYLEQLLDQQVTHRTARTVEHDDAVFFQHPIGAEFTQPLAMAAILVVVK